VDTLPCPRGALSAGESCRIHSEAGGDTITVGTYADADAGQYSGSAYLYAPSIALLPAMPLWGLSLLGATLVLAGTAVTSHLSARAGEGAAPRR
jgi:hypothetical protein